MAISCAVVSVWVLCTMLHTYNDERGDLHISRNAFIFFLIFIVVMAYYLGWGRYVEQWGGDANRNNGILNDLVYRSWPIIYSDHQGGKCMLTYYLLHFIVPGFIGKLFLSYRLAELVFALWSCIGIFLVYFQLLLGLRVKTFGKQFFVILVLFFFMQPLVMGRPIIEYLYPDTVFYGGTGETLWCTENLQLPLQSNWSNLYYDFQQAIEPWLVTIIFIENNRQVQYYVPLLLPVLMYGAFPFVALLPYALVYVFMYLQSLQYNWKKWLSEVFSFSNISISCTLGTVFIVYLLGNVLGDKPIEVSTRLLAWPGLYGNLILFVLLVLIPFPLLVWRENRYNPIWYITFMLLLVFPFVKVGLFNDQVKFGVVVQFYLMFMLLQYIFEYNNKDTWKKNLKWMFTLLLLVCSFTIPFQHLLKQIKEDDIYSLAEDYSCGTLENWSDRSNPAIRVDLKYNYFTYNLESSFFYKYIARK